MEPPADFLKVRLLFRRMRVEVFSHLLKFSGEFLSAQPNFRHEPRRLPYKPQEGDGLQDQSEDDADSH